MERNSLPRTVVDNYLKILKAPVDLVVRSTIGRDELSPARIAVDRADASARDFLGRALRDETLQGEARRRRAAADERARALQLRSEAQRKAQEADQEFAQRKDAAEENRRRADERAEERVEQTEEARRQSIQNIERSAQQREEASAKAAQRAEAAVATEARHHRLNDLEAQTEALDAKEEALRKRQEAALLGDAAMEAKAARKQSG